MNDVLIQWDIVNGVRVLVASKRSYKVSNDNRLNGNNNLSETGSFTKNRSINNLTNNQSNSYLNNSTAGLSANSSNQLAAIRHKNVIPSKDKSQQQHLSAASSNNNSPNNNQLKTKDEYNSKTTKDKNNQQSEFTDLFGTPIKAKSKQKEIKSKKSKSSSEKSNNSRSSTPTSTISSNQLISSKDYLEFKKNKHISSKDKLNKSNSSNSSSNSHQSRSLLQKFDKLSKIKKELELPLGSSNKIKSPNISTSKYDDKKYHSKISGNLSSSASSLNSIEEDKIKKKSKQRSDSVSSNDSYKSTHSVLSSASSSSVSLSVKSNSSRASSLNLSSINVKQQSKKRTEQQNSPETKKKKKDLSGSLNSKNIKKESNIGVSRTLSSSLSSINSDYKTKDESIRKSKNKSKDKSEHKDTSKDKSKSKSKDELKDDYFSSKKTDEKDELGKKERKEKRKHKDDENSDKKKYKSNKKNKSSEPSKDEERNSKKHKSSKDLSAEKIIKEKNKDSINKQTSHKEHNLKKEETTSTRFSFSNNNSTGLTTLEITSVKNVKMLQSESKKSKQHQDQSLIQSDKRSFKTDKSSSLYSSPLAKNNYDETPTSSPCFTSDDYYKRSKETDENKQKTQKLNDYEKIMSDMRKKREISPLSPDLNSELNFGLDDNDYQSNDEESGAFKSNYYDDLNEDEQTIKKSKKDKSTNSYLDESDHELDEDDFHVEYVNELIHLQKQINELKDKKLLHEIVEIVRESGKFKMNGTLFDFDLLKLDKKIIKKVKLCFS